MPRLHLLPSATCSSIVGLNSPGGESHPQWTSYGPALGSVWVSDLTHSSLCLLMISICILNQALHSSCGVVEGASMRSFYSLTMLAARHGDEIASLVWDCSKSSGALSHCMTCEHAVAFQMTDHRLFMLCCSSQTSSNVTCFLMYAVGMQVCHSGDLFHLPWQNLGNSCQRAESASTPFRTIYLSKCSCRLAWSHFAL